VDTAVDAMKNGAVDYIAKPFTPDQIHEKVEKAIEQRTLILDEFYLKKEISSHHGFNQFVGESK
jgi:DNA-binding NtrC family response regulator